MQRWGLLLLSKVISFLLARVSSRSYFYLQKSRENAIESPPPPLFCFHSVLTVSIIIFPIGCFPSSFVERVGPICRSCVESRKSEESSNNVVGKRVRYSFLLLELLVILMFEDLHHDEILDIIEFWLFNRLFLSRLIQKSETFYFFPSHLSTW